MPCNESSSERPEDILVVWRDGYLRALPARLQPKNAGARTYVAVDTLPSVGSLRASANDCDLNAMPAAAGTLRSVADALPGSEA